MIQMILLAKQNRHRGSDKYMDTKEEVGCGGRNWEFGIDMIGTVYKIDN